LRDLCRQGLTILQADQRSRSAGLSDQVIFLVPGGMLAWFGPADEAFTYLRRLVPRGVVKDLFGLKEALEILANPQVQEGTEWARRFRADPAYQKYVDDPLDNKFPDLLLETRPLIRLRLRSSAQEKLPPPILPYASTRKQFMLLIRRNFRLLSREKTALWMLTVPPVVALIELAFSAGIRTDPGLALVALGIQVFLAMLTAAVLFQGEISKDRAVYWRESRTNSLSVAYILSKVWMVALLAVYQGLVWTVMHLVATGSAGGTQSVLPFAITFFLVTFIGGLLGLIVSAVSGTPLRSTGWLLLLTIPQLLMEGSLVPAVSLGFPFNVLSRINPSRYAYEALLAIQGFQAGLRGIPLNSWLVLAATSLALILLLMIVQRSSREDRR
jgi:ABC transport system ATP-binding/permease protein